MATDLEALARAVKQAQFRQHRTLDAALLKAGVSLVQWDALRAIATMPGASAHALALATFQTDQSFGTLATRLEAHGFVRREPGKGRRTLHHLTPEGRRVLANAGAVAQKVRKSLFAPLPEADREALQRILAALLAEGQDPTR
jgi:DNA-binding MarR family transcriptional regulator